MLIVDVPAPNERFVVIPISIEGCPELNVIKDAFKFIARILELLENKIPIVTA